MGWFQQTPRPGFTKATVSAWRVSLEARGLGSSSIIIRMSAIRKLAGEAADNGLLAPELAAGISCVKSAKTQASAVGTGFRNVRRRLSSARLTSRRFVAYGTARFWLFCLDAGFGDSEVAALTFSHLQQRDGRWCILDLV